MGDFNYGQTPSDSQIVDRHTYYREVVTRMYQRFLETGAEYPGTDPTAVFVIDQVAIMFVACEELGALCNNLTKELSAVKAQLPLGVRYDNSTIN